MKIKQKLKQSSWNEDKKAQKGIRGFVKVPEAEQKNSPLTVMLTKAQKDFLTAYCKRQDITASNLIRFMIYDYLKKQNEDFSMFEQQPSNQTI